MKTWNDYKNHVKNNDSEIGKDIEDIENISAIVSAMIAKRNALG